MDMLNLLSNNMAIILTRVLEVCIGLLAIVNFRWQSKSMQKMSEKEWLEEVEKRDKEIEHLKIKANMWRVRYESLTNKHKRT